MRKIILGLAVTLDGFIEGPNGEYDWCFTDQDYGMTDFLKRIDAIFYGRKSYEMMMSASVEAPGGGTPWKGIKNYVFSNTLKNDGKDFELVSGDIEKKVTEIKNMEGKDIWLFGGASLTSSLLNAGLVDELGMAVHPILLGEGKPLFQGIQKRIKTKLIDSKAYSSGLVYLTYDVVKL
jgi:dihydrofolate reductase